MRVTFNLHVLIFEKGQKKYLTYKIQNIIR